MLKKRFNLRIVAAIIACLAVTTVFASCDKDSSDDDSGKSNNSQIVGTWLNGDQSAVNWTEGEWTDKDFFSILGHVAVLFEFKADGTYLRRFRAYNMFGDSFLEHKGKYRVEGNRIIVFNRTETFIDFYDSKENYKNKALAGEGTYYYQVTQSGYGEYAADALFIEDFVEALSNTNRYYDKK